MPHVHSFGPFEVERVTEDHAIIRRHDGLPPEPTFYEMQHMKCVVFGGRATAVEVFPDVRELVDGQNQRHLWRVERDVFPNLMNLESS